MAHVVCVANQKGGVGKTTSSVNLAAAFARLGKKVLLLDLDPQGNASSGLGISKNKFQEANLYHVLAGEIKLEEVLVPTHSENLFVVPCTQDLSGIEIELSQHTTKEHMLRLAIEQLPPFFDIIMIDCPPSLGLLTLNGLAASRHYIIPLQCEFFALEGLSSFVQIVQLVRKSLNPHLKPLGILLTMHDQRNRLSHQVVSEVRKHFGPMVLETTIPRNVRLSEAPSFGQSIFEYDPECMGARAYMSAAKEYLMRLETQPAPAQTSPTHLSTTPA